MTAAICWRSPGSIAPAKVTRSLPARAKGSAASPLTKARTRSCSLGVSRPMCCSSSSCSFLVTASPSLTLRRVTQSGSSVPSSEPDSDIRPNGSILIPESHAKRAPDRQAYGRATRQEACPRAHGAFRSSTQADCRRWRGRRGKVGRVAQRTRVGEDSADAHTEERAEHLTMRSNRKKKNVADVKVATGIQSPLLLVWRTRGWGKSPSVPLCQRGKRTQSPFSKGGGPSTRLPSASLGTDRAGGLLLAPLWKRGAWGDFDSRRIRVKFSRPRTVQPTL